MTNSSTDTPEEAQAGWNELWKDVCARDVIIFVIGPTGAGKSTFVKAVASPSCRNRDAIKEDHSLFSCTKDFIPVFISTSKPSGLSPETKSKLEDDTRRLIVVDTPGYEDTTMPLAVLRRKLAMCLQAMLKRKLSIGGIVYLYGATQNRFPQEKFIEHLSDYDGLLPTPYQSIALGLTGNTEGDNARTEQLEREHWGAHISGGSHYATIPASLCVQHWNALDHIVCHFRETDTREGTKRKISDLRRGTRKRTFNLNFSWLRKLFTFRN